MKKEDTNLKNNLEVITEQNEIKPDKKTINHIWILVGMGLLVSLVIASELLGLKK